MAEPEPGRRKRLTKLSDELRRRLEQRGLMLVDLANTVRTPTETLRTWFHRNAFREDALRGILEELDWKIKFAELETSFRFTLVRPRSRQPNPDESLADVFAGIDRTRNKLDQLVRHFSSDVQRCFSAMGRDDLFVLVSLDTQPFEFDERHWTELGRPVTEAISRGALCVYLRPDSQVLKAFAKWGLNEKLRVSSFKEEIAGFRERVVTHLCRSGGFTESEAKRTAETRLTLLLCNKSPLWMMNVSWGCFFTRDRGSRPVARVSVKMPSDFGGIVMLPHDDRLAHRFTTSLESALKDHPPNDTVGREIRRRLKLFSPLL